MNTHSKVKNKKCKIKRVYFKEYQNCTCRRKIRVREGGDRQKNYIIFIFRIIPYIGAQIAFIPLIPSLTLGLPCGVWHMLRGECPTIIFMCFITQQLRRSPVCLKEEKSIDLAIFRHATMSVHCLPSTFINFNIPVPPACLVTKHVCIYNLYIKQVKCYMTVCCISLAVHFLPVLSK